MTERTEAIAVFRCIYCDRTTTEPGTLIITAGGDAYVVFDHRPTCCYGARMDDYDAVTPRLGTAPA